MCSPSAALPIRVTAPAGRLVRFGQRKREQRWNRNRCASPPLTLLIRQEVAVGVLNMATIDRAIDDEAVALRSTHRPRRNEGGGCEFDATLSRICWSQPGDHRRGRRRRGR